MATNLLRQRKGRRPEIAHQEAVWVMTILGLVWLLVGCGGEAVAGYKIVAPASISLGSTIPSPIEKVVLTLSGDLDLKNSADNLKFDMDTLEKLGLVQYTISDPWRKSDVTYTGVLMSELTKFAGTSPSASTIHMVALDDYEVDIPMADIQKWPILLATRSNGEYMQIDSGGPTRLIYPWHHNSDIDLVSTKDLSIWSIETMEIR